MTALPAVDLLLRSGLFDRAYYEAQRGETFPDERAAAEDFVAVGSSRRLSPHPLLDLASMPAEVRRLWVRGRWRRVVSFLDSDEGRAAPWGPLFDPRQVRDASAAELPLTTFLRRAADDTALPVPADRPGPRPVLGEAMAGMRAAADRAARAVRRPSSAEVDWSVEEEALDRRDPDLVSVVVTVTEPHGLALRAVRGLLETAGHDPAGARQEIVLVGCGTPLHVLLAVHAELLGTDAEVHRVGEADDPALARAAGFARSRGRRVVFLPGDARVRRGWSAALLAALGSGVADGAVPLVLDDRDLVLSPAALRGHPPEDAYGLVEAGSADVDGEVWAADAATVVRRRSTSPAYPSARVAVAPLARVSRPDEAPLPTDPVRLAGAGRRRWGLKLPSTPGYWGDDWGDTHFADGVAAALRELGQQAVTHRRGAHDVPVTRLDDVALAIRGRHPIPARAGVCNVLWVISHPDTVSVEELAGYDLVLAASEPWSARMTRTWGRPVLPLLQATAMGPAPELGPRSPEALFVGNAGPGRRRALVLAAVEAGIPLAVHGRGWEGLLPPGAWKGEHLPNERLEEAYRQHAVVLSDHWPAMARHGFVANRVFDAVAAGAWVLSDPVAGIGSVFGEEVAVCRDPGEVLTGYRRALAAGRPPSGAAARVREQHSFRARARVLVDLVDGMLGPT